MYGKVLILTILAVITAYYFDTAFFVSLLKVFTSNKPNPKKSNLFTLGDLKLYNGVDKPELYLAILGKVYDVSKGIKHYGPGKSYNIFIGRDSSRSFVTGKFGQNDADDNVADFTNDEFRSLKHWVDFYGKEYTAVGKLIGRYYDENGKLTPYGKQIRKLLKGAHLEKESKDVEKLKYPPCNIEWDADRGTRVWCTSRSGGVVRNWVGVPRQLYELGSQEHRCACVQTKDSGANLKEYEGCDSNSDSCYIKS